MSEFQFQSRKSEALRKGEHVTTVQRVPRSRSTQSRGMKSGSKIGNSFATHSLAASPSTDSTLEAPDISETQNRTKLQSESAQSGGARSGSKTSSPSVVSTLEAAQSPTVALNKSVSMNRSDIIDEKLPLPPGPRRHRLDPNKAPGMPLDHKDSLCGRMIHYVTGGDNPKKVSGTYVPGVRMDGATEGEYPPGMFAQHVRNHGALKAFVNCFAGYFNTMGGNIPPCPEECPPKNHNLNENSNTANPLKKTAYEFPWSIRAGFLPERIEVFELMDSPTETKKPGEAQTGSAGSSSPSSTSSPDSPLAKESMGKTAKASSSRKSKVFSAAPKESSSRNHPEKNNNNNRSESNPSLPANEGGAAPSSRASLPAAAALGSGGVTASTAASAAAATATKAAVTESVSGTSRSSAGSGSVRSGSNARRDVKLAAKIDGSLWRGLQHQRQQQREKDQRLQHQYSRQDQRQYSQQEQRQRREMNQGNTNHNRNSETALNWRRSDISRGSLTSNLVEQYRQKIESKVDKTKKALMHNLPSIHQELRSRKNGAQTSCSAESMDPEAKNQQKLLQFIHQQNVEWRPTPASGML